MKMKRNKTGTPIAEILNPRGGLATGLEKTIRQANWLDVMCEYWLSHHGDNVQRAMYDPPTYDLPKAFPGAARFNKARKECGAFEGQSGNPASYKWKVLKSGEGKWVRGNSDLGNPLTVPVNTPAVAAVWDWPAVFQHWLDGGLARSVAALQENLPEQNVLKIQKEMAK